MGEHSPGTRCSMGDLSIAVTGKSSGARPNVGSVAQRMDRRHISGGSRRSKVALRLESEKSHSRSDTERRGHS